MASYLRQKQQHLCQLGHAHRVAAPGPRSRTTALDPFVEVIPGPALPYDPTYHLLFRTDLVRRAARVYAPDVIEAHSPYVAAHCLRGLRGHGYVRTFFWHADFVDTDVRPFVEKRLGKNIGSLAAIPLWRWVRAIAHESDAVIATSRGQFAKLEAHGVKNAVRIPFGVDTEIFHPGRADAAVRSTSLEGSTGPLVVLVGRLSHEKHWEIAFDAFGFLADKRPNARLLVVGDGPERSNLEARASHLGKNRVRFAGFVKNREALAEILASADLLLHACPFETFGLSIAEALACGLPCVVPDRGGAAEQEGALLYRTFDARDAAARALATLDDAAYRSCTLAAAKDVRTMTTHFRELLALYEGLRAARPSARVVNEAR